MRSGAAAAVRGSRFARGVAVFTAGLLLGLSLLYLGPGDTTLVGEFLTIWPPELWALAASVVASLVLLGDRGSGLVLAIGIVLFLLATSDWPPLLRALDRDSGSAASRGAGFRLVTWNVARTPDLSALEPLKPDVLLFQESAPVSSQAVRSPYWTGFHWVGTTDPAIFSRYAMDVGPISATAPWVWAPPQAVVLRLAAGRRVLVVNVRLMLPGVVRKLASLDDAIDLRSAHAARLEQLDLLADFVGKSRASLGQIPTVVCGDFNTPARAASVRALAPLADVWPSSGRGWGATMGADWPIARIDQCWSSEGVRPLRSWVERGRGSDHRMLVVDFEIR